MAEETIEDFAEDVVIEARVVKSTVQDLEIPYVDFATFLKDTWGKVPDMTAIIDASTAQRHTRKELQESCEQIAAGLQELGLEPGDIMGFVSGNSVDLVQAFVGAIFAGAKIACIKTGFNEREMTRLLKMTNPSVVYTDMANAEKAKEACKNVPSVKALVVSGEYNGMVSFEKLKQTPRSQFKSPAPADPEDVLLVFQTSGSTGLPKAALISHRNFIAELVTVGYKNEGFRKGGVCLAYLPLMHASALWIIFSMLTHHVEAVVAAPTNISEALAPIPKYRVSALIIYPTHGQLIAQRGLPPSLDVSSVRAVYIGGSCVAPKVLRGLHQVFRGCIVAFGYGLTEVCCAIAHTRGMCHDFKTVGIPMPYVSVKVVDVETGKKLGPGECGEIRIKGPTCFKGYLDNPGATAAIFDEEGFLKSGDTGYYSARGELYVLDRIKDLIKCMDQQVAPAELEELLQEHPDVEQAAVAGIPHPYYGEAPIAFLVLRRCPSTDQEAQAKKQAITAYIKDLVAPHKRLHGGVEFVDSIPQTETGKPHRRQLRDCYLQKKERTAGQD